MAGIGYKDLEIYKLARALAFDCHQLSINKLPKYELYEEGSQLRRASKSIVANIVEGFSRRRYKNEFIKFLVYAIGSCNESREHLEILFETGSLTDKETFEQLQENFDKLSRKLSNFIKTVESDHKT